MAAILDDGRRDSAADARADDGRWTWAEFAVVGLVFVVCMAGAATIPVKHCPDEAGRLQLVQWMVNTGTLPTGYEPQVTMYDWGFSYALRPYLASMISAVFARVAMLFSSSEGVQLVAARLTSVLSATVCAIYLVKLGRRTLRRRMSAALLAVLVCFLPQVAYLGMYQNNDVFGLMAVTVMLYYFVEAYQTRWSLRSCVGMAAGMSVGLLAYYSIFGWILVVGAACAVTVAQDDRLDDPRGVLTRRLALVLGICLALAGWFFVRNALLHEGDFLGLASEYRSRERYLAQGAELVDYVNLREQGFSLPGFLLRNGGEFFWMTARSFVGTFGHMIFYLPLVRYGIYYTLIAEGVVLSVVEWLRRRPERSGRLLMRVMLCGSGITLALHTWASYARDYQPQGRYVITVMLLLGYAMAFGVDRTERRLAVPLAATWLLLFAMSCVDTMSQMLV